MKRLFLGWGAVFLVVPGVLALAGARVNVTPSVPVGLYWTTSQPVTRGAYVSFCPPDDPVFREARERGYLAAGYCPAGTLPLIKRVAALPGDRVAIGAGTAVNGELLREGEALAADPSGRALHAYTGHFVLNDGQVLLMGQWRGSFDGRYFGPVERAGVQDVLVPIWVLRG
jgi:conjugative transfer signal peptidase TraF